MKAIITGATGFLGSHLVELLQGEGWDVIAIGRNDVIGNQLISESVEYYHANITDEAQLASVFEFADVVFHCAALSTDWGEYKEFHQINVQGTRNVLNCAINVGVKRLVYVSSTSVYFDYRDRFNLSEEQNLKRGFANFYSETKFLGEQVVIEESGDAIEYVIIRPRGIIGEGDTSIMPRILRLARKGWFPLINGGNAILDVTYVKNVAYALSLAAMTAEAAGECFNITNDEPIKLRKLLELTFKKLGIHVRLIPVPYQLVQTVARFLHTFHRTVGKGQPALTRYSVGLISKSQTLDINKAKKILGYCPQYTLDDAISTYVQKRDNV